MQDPPSVVGVVDAPARRSTTVSFHDVTSPMNSDSILRKGKWTTEEEDYANKIISLFNRGLLPIGAGTTLRSYLSDKLHCDPMRITKKFAGASCIGKQVFQPSESLQGERSDEIQELDVLETLFYHRVGDRSIGAHRQSPEDETDSQGGHVHSKTVGVKWNREEGDTDISSAKHRSDFGGKVKSEKSSRPSSSSSGSSGMRSVVSAPDFSELKMLHESAEKAGVGRKRAFQMGNFNGKQRSQSVTDFMDFEHYISDDSAAGDLLMQFASKVTGTQSDEDVNSEDNVGECSGPVTKFISSSTIGKNSSNTKILKSPVKRTEGNFFERKEKSSESVSSNIGYDEATGSRSVLESGSGTEKDPVSGDGPWIRGGVAESKFDDQDPFNNEDEEDEEPPLIVDQSNSLSCSSPHSNIGHNYEDEEEECYSNPCDSRNTETDKKSIDGVEKSLQLQKDFPSVSITSSNRATEENDQAAIGQSNITNVPCPRIRTVTEENPEPQPPVKTTVPDVLDSTLRSDAVQDPLCVPTAVPPNKHTVESCIRNILHSNEK